MGSRLIASDKIQKADVILVLAGDNNGERVNEGVALYKKGYAPRMLMSGGPLAWHLTYAEWMKKQAILLGVPERSILIQDRSLSTIEDAKFSLPIIKEKNIKSVILVTSPAHTRRAKRVFNKVFSADKIQVMVWPVKKSDFNPKYWWKSNEDIQIVVYEYTCEIFYFMKGY
ncbi:MAG: YdcF family protein [Candidatus Margulisiibacteriota bacterium]